MPSTRPAVPAAATDGRSQRRIVTRGRIVDAVTALIHDGHLAPTAEQVADRAGVGLRTVFRHFADMDALYREIGDDIDARLLPVLRTPLDARTWQQRVLQSLDIRTEAYDRVAAVHLATQMHRHASAAVADDAKRIVSVQRRLLKRLLPIEVAADAVFFDALDLMLSIEVWVRLRREQRLSADDARRVMRLGVEALMSRGRRAPSARAASKPTGR
jgi:AcrR family transcriptional regulator